MSGPTSSHVPAGRLAGAAGIVAALLASSCCILPLLLIVSGIAGAGIMVSMMRYEWIALPLGSVGLVLAWTVYLLQKRRCETDGCRFVGRRTNQIQLGIATLVVVVALLLKVFPSWTASVLQSMS